jgi:hypothetical protein
MVNKGILAIIIVVVIIAIGGVYLYATSTSSNNVAAQNTSQNLTVNKTQTINHTESNKTIKTNITAEQAKEIAKQACGSGFYPGTPNLQYMEASGGFKGGYVWVVPIIHDGKEGAGIIIDAQTGENLGEG